jgi:hypothetical protein
MFVNKILSKYIHVGSYFEGFIVTKPMVQSEFNLNDYYKSYGFFKICLKLSASASSDDVG